VVTVVAVSGSSLLAHGLTGGRCASPEQGGASPQASGQQRRFSGTVDRSACDPWKQHQIFIVEIPANEPKS